MRHKRWKKCNLDELRGAHYGLRILRTSPRITRPALEILDMLLEEIESESRHLTKKAKAGAKS